MDMIIRLSINQKCARPCMAIFLVSSMSLLQITETALQILADPPDINMIDVKPLTIKCTYLPDTNATNKISLQSLTFSKRGQVSGTFDPISELTLSNPNSPIITNSQNLGTTSASGYILKDDGTSYLSVTWSAPSHKEAGTFGCTAHTLDEMGVSTTELQETEVRDDSILVLGQKLKSLQNEVKQQEICCHLATARLTEFEVWRKTISTSMKYFADRLVFLKSTEHKNRIYIVSNFTVSDITTAEAVCQTMGGYLAEVADAQDWAFITAMLNTTHFRSFYIGGKDDVTEGKWYWTHSRQPLTFAPWNTGEPNNSGFGDEDCLEIFTIGPSSSPKYALNDISCTKRRTDTFICEIPNYHHL